MGRRKFAGWRSQGIVTNVRPAARDLMEIGEILAAGLMRLQARKSSGLTGENGENSLHYDASQSGHANPFSPEVDA
jgi:hypothetical protein